MNKEKLKKIWEVFTTQPGPAYTFMCPLHTRRLRAAPSPSRRGQELLVLGFRKIYGLSHSSWPGSLGGLGSPCMIKSCPQSE